MFSYHDLKTMIYFTESGFGAIALIAAAYIQRMADMAGGRIDLFLCSMVLFLVGILCILFGYVTYLLRDDPDVWR